MKNPTIEQVNQSDCYNVAIRYLQNKYGKTVCGSYKVPPSEDNTDWAIHLLIRQYQFGYKVRYELYDALVDLGEITPQEN